ncbi:MAG: hypothetical protein JRJ39_11865 [Deltaproteobacteria bacterium]|nr:hypothetical protein [Deltaproteobacteria bacterium]
MAQHIDMALRKEALSERVKIFTTNPKKIYNVLKNTFHHIPAEKYIPSHTRYRR